MSCFNLNLLDISALIWLIFQSNTLFEVLISQYHFTQSWISLNSLLYTSHITSSVHISNNNEEWWWNNEPDTYLGDYWRRLVTWHNWARWHHPMRITGWRAPKLYKMNEDDFTRPDGYIAINMNIVQGITFYFSWKYVCASPNPCLVKAEKARWTLLSPQKICPLWCL